MKISKKEFVKLKKSIISGIEYSETLKELKSHLKAILTIKVFSHKIKQPKLLEDKCFHCRTKEAYSEEYDAYYCPKCLFWLEKICPDRSCEYCKDRPKYPIKSWRKK